MVTFKSKGIKRVLLFRRIPVIMRCEKGFNPVVVILLADPIGDGHCDVGHLEPLAEGPRIALSGTGWLSTAASWACA
jgi:hypothetical protein